MEINGKTVVLTGAAGGIGRAIATEMTHLGAKLVCVDNNDEGLKRLASELNEVGAETVSLALDVTDREQVQRMVSETLETFGQIDILINNAAVLRGIGPMWKVAPELWRRDLEVNLFGSFLLIREILPSMMEHNEGIIVNMTGGGFKDPNPAGSGYGCSKAAIGRLTDTLAAELGADCNIQVYGLAPGFVRSGITEFLAQAEAGKPWFDFVEEWLREGKDNSAEGVAEQISKLISISTPALSGRIFYWNDDLDAIAARAEEIRDRDLLQLRYRAE